MGFAAALAGAGLPLATASLSDDLPGAWEAVLPEALLLDLPAGTLAASGFAAAGLATGALEVRADLLDEVADVLLAALA